MRTILIFLTLIVFSCASGIREKSGRGEPLTVRYLNMNLVFSYVLKTDQDALKLKNEMDDLLKSIGELDEIKKSGSGAAEIEKQIEDKKKRYAVIQKDEEYYKTRIYNKINSAVKSVAKGMGADYVLSLEEGIIYADRKYDITEDVIREIVKLDKRNAPVSR